MRKILILGILLFYLGSCSVDDTVAVEEYYFETVPIETVVMPAEFELGENYVIEYSYYKPSNCHVFNDLNYISDFNTLTIFVVNTVFPDAQSPCMTLNDELITRVFNFTADNSETYYFKFWKGVDEEGRDVFLEIEVPVN